MPADIIELNEHRPHVAGQAKCMNCNHVWTAVAPVGTTQLECPNCSFLTGAWYTQMQSGTTTIWCCPCDNDLFTLPATGVPMCARCGLYAQGWTDGR